MKILDYLIVKTLPFVPKSIVGQLSKSYIAGATLDQAVDVVKRLNSEGFCVTVDVLGEFVESIDQVEGSVDEYLEVLDAIQTHELDANISIKPTSFGLLLDYDFCKKQLSVLMERVVKDGSFLRIDMEDSPCTDKTIRLHHEFRETYSKHVGIVLQAYMRRNLSDIEHITQADYTNFRLCKGIYVEPREVAFKGYQDVRKNYLDSLDAMFRAGAYVGIATHDDVLIEKAETMIRSLGLTRDQYEFQMLLGVRERLRNTLRDRGHKVRIYVPFGKDWYGYSTRRLKENPALAGTFFKAMFYKG
jgi:proline dehydrogenase